MEGRSQRAAPDQDPGGSAPPRGGFERSALPLIAALFGSAFFVSLVASVPASFLARYVVPPVEINGYSGTLWSGSAQMAGGHGLDWHVDPAGSLVALSAVLDAEIRGPGTELAGRVSLHGMRGQDLRVEGLNGPVAWPLVAALAPQLAITCDAAAVIENLSLASLDGSRRGTGRLQAGPGTCMRTDRGMTPEPVPVPALVARITTEPTGLLAVLTQADAPGTALAEAVITAEDVLKVTVFPAGAALVPGMPASGETTLEFPLTGLP